MSDQEESFETGRLIALVHYVIAKIDPSKFGYVKLNRILWYADLEYYRWNGVSFSGLRHYARTPQGPMSKDITMAVSRLVRDGKVAERSVQGADYARREIVSLKPPDLSRFTLEEIAALAKVIEAVVPLTATQLRQMTLEDSQWKELGNDAVMSIATGSIVTRPLTSK